MKNSLILCALLTLGPVCYAQQSNITDYTELTDTKPHDSEAVWNKITTPTQLSWASTDVRYPKLSIPTVTKTSRWQTKAWKGERVNAQAVLWTTNDLSDATITVSELKNGSSVIPASNVTTNFVRYVMTDELNKERTGGCGVRENKAEWDSSIVADVLDIVKMRDVAARTTQPIWMNVWVPSDARPGKYKGTLTVSGKNFQPMKLQVEIDVLNRTLPEPKDWKFHLDLWQNPYSVARYYNVPLWSKEHFDAMRPIMKMLANAGQRAITTSIMHKPWAGQTEDHFDSMVFRMKKLDGSWEYDYTVFDKWVDFMMNDIGINDLISCYTMIPWALSFDYYDQATNRIQFIEAKPGDAAYADYWGSFLKDFSRHLRAKGWFEKTAISMDERPMKDMLATLKVIRKADKDFKVSLAGTYHDELVKELHDYCIAIGEKFPAEVIKSRKEAGQVTTYYTCCTEPRPNTFTFSAPAEAEWLGWFAAKENLDGYLRWALNSWVKNPLQDSRFTAWAAGDTYMIYPEGRSSIRFERLIEGIQSYEKIRILKEEFEKKGNKSAIKKIDKILKAFDEFSLEEIPAATVVTKAKEAINKY